MRETLRWLRVTLCMVGLAACGSGRPSGDDDGGGDDGGGDDAPSMPPASCVDLMPTCGPGGNDSCCSSPKIDGGPFYRSYDLAGDGNSGDMTAPAMISSFRLDKYEVTVGRFRKFVEAGMGTQANPPLEGAGAHAAIAGSGWSASWNTKLATSRDALTAAVKCNTTFQAWTDAASLNEARPMNCLTWYEAMAFCAWDGGYLPTEAEWNYVAAGGEQQNAYPWASPTVDGTHASYYDGTSCVGDGMMGCALTDLVAVGTKPDGNGRYGQSELAGNVSEWTLDSISPYPNPCTDCAKLTDAGDRVIRGGSFGESAFYLRTGVRGSSGPADRSHGIGVRCARAP